MFVYDGVEEFAIPPAGGEVVAAQALVSLHHPLGPEQQLLFGRHVVRLTVHLNVRDLEGGHGAIQSETSGAEGAERNITYRTCVSVVKSPLILFLKFKVSLQLTPG